MVVVANCARKSFTLGLVSLISAFDNRLDELVGHIYHTCVYVYNFHAETTYFFLSHSPARFSFLQLLHYMVIARMLPYSDSTQTPF